MSQRLKLLNQHIENLTLLDVKKRLAKYIYDEYKKTNQDNKIKTDFIELTISKYDLASHLGTILETLSRTLKKLQEENYISVEGKKIIIKDIKKLKNCCS